MGDWDRCQAAALEYIHSVGFFEALALEFRGRCGFYRTMLHGERFNLDMARDLYEWQVFRLREKSYEPGGLDEIKESVLAGVAVLRREGYREHAENLEDQLRSAPGRVAAELANPQPGPVAAQPTPFGQSTPFAPPTPTAPPTPVAQPTPVIPPTAVAPPPPTAPRPVPPSPPPTPVATQPPPPPRPAPAPQLVPTAASSLGTAFFVRPDGVLLTALHLVEGARSILVRCPGREPAAATISNSARGQDLAVLKTSLAAPAYLNMREARGVELGDPIFAVGFPAAGAAAAASRLSDRAVSAVSGNGFPSDDRAGPAWQFRWTGGHGRRVGRGRGQLDHRHHSAAQSAEHPAAERQLGRQGGLRQAAFPPAPRHALSQEQARSDRPRDSSSLSGDGHQVAVSTQPLVYCRTNSWTRPHASAEASANSAYLRSKKLWGAPG